MKYSRYFRILIFTENKIEIYSSIKIFKTKNSQSNITYIDIPKDLSMDWNEIPNKFPQEELKRIEDTVMIEQCIIERNRRHLNQTKGILYTIETLQSLLGLDSRTSFGNSVMEGNADLT